MARDRVHDPELGQRQQHHLALPQHLQALAVERECAALHRLRAVGGPRQRLDAAEQGVHARQQVREAEVLGEEVVGAEAQARHGVELGVARGQEDDRQLGAAGAQLAAQLVAAFGFLAERNVDDHEVGEPRGEGLQRGTAARIGAHGMALAANAAA